MRFLVLPYADSHNSQPRDEVAFDVCDDGSILSIEIDVFEGMERRASRSGT